VVGQRPANTDALTGLRGIAALWVAVFHFDILLEKSSLSRQFGPRALLQHGYLAVDIFFVLSGFVMALSYGHYFARGFSGRKYGVFMMRRLARVYPLYIAMTALTVALLMRHAGVVPLLAGRAGELISNIFLAQNWGFSRCIVVPAWSISVEALAYVGFPLLALVFLHGARAWLAAGTLLCLAGFVFLAVHPPPASHAQIGILDIHQDYSLLPDIRCLAGFGLGLGSYRYASRGGAAAWRIPPWVNLAGSLLLLVTLMVPRLDLLSVLLIPLLILGLLDDGILARALRTRAVLFLGEVSYALYLVHGDILVVVDRLLATQAAHSVGRPAAVTLALVSFVVTVIAVAAAAHTLLEVPARTWIRRLEAVFDRSAEREVLASERQGRADMS